jgi:hypothetical protein
LGDLGHRRLDRGAACSHRGRAIIESSDTTVTDCSRSLTLDPVPGSYAICRWGPGDSLPPWVMQGEFFSVTRTPEELSAVCDVAVVPSGVKAEGPWLVLAVRGPLDFNITGVLAALAAPLASAGISIFAISTYDTDYLLVRDREMDRAVRALREAGHNISGARETSQGAAV